MSAHQTKLLFGLMDELGFCFAIELNLCWFAVFELKQRLANDEMK
jgi:hypothetical protein